MIYLSDKPYFYTVALSYASMAVFVICAVIEGYGGVPFKSYSGISLMTYCALMKAISTGTKFAY